MSAWQLICKKAIHVVCCRVYCNHLSYSHIQHSFLPLLFGYSRVYCTIKMTLSFYFPIIYTDINECNGVNGCQQLCTNTEGSYTCSCSEGFDLAEDGKRCNGIEYHIPRSLLINLSITYTAKQFCVDGVRCSHICAVADFEERCFCPVGFTLMTPTTCAGKYFMCYLWE